MNRQKTGRFQKTSCLLAAFGTLAALGVATAHADGMHAPLRPRSVTVAPPVVVIKIADAILEEYHGGNPDHRTTLVRTEETAQNTKPMAVNKKRS